MEIRVWGSRGSFICPEEGFSRYGGNTTCLQITDAQGRTLLLDAGSGLIRFGRHVLEQGVPESPVFHLLLSHTHIDHLQGFSFFTPIHFPNTRVKIYCAGHEVNRVEDTFKRMFHKSYSPIQKIENLQANIEFIELEESHSYNVNGFMVSPLFLEHPSPTFGFRVHSGEKSFGLITDHEVRDPHLNARVVDFFQGCDLVFHDGQYTPEEYDSAVGWGHSSIDAAIQNGKDTGTPRLGIFHHSPDHDDEDLGELEARYTAANPDMDLFWVREDMSISL
ncbi:MBL fold metallo-hydrolase [Myxococcota bacterium]|nr:MBL fold metallo-hydrolase [Myxococcota bacterium]MBU1536844.1 MBL fold metallo-hydrolase [Myxococcota bacterium]